MFKVCELCSTIYENNKEEEATCKECGGNLVTENIEYENED